MVRHRLTRSCQMQYLRGKLLRAENLGHGTPPISAIHLYQGNIPLNKRISAHSGELAGGCLQQENMTERSSALGLLGLPIFRFSRSRRVLMRWILKLSFRRW